MRRTRTRLLSLLLVAGLVAGCSPASSTSIATQRLTPQPDGWRGIPLEIHRPLPDVTLADTTGEPVNLARDLTGDPTLVFFGFTSCFDVCPIHLRTIASAMDSAGVSYDDLMAT